MPLRVEAYTATGIATGTVAAPGHVRGYVEGLTDLIVEGSEWLPLDGSPGRQADNMKLAVDDLLLIVSDELDDVPGHAQWHTIDLDAGPYRIEGELSTMPGFDPGRALARPSGQFVLLRDVRITLLSEPTGGEVRCAHALVNRYTVDRIAADIMLGFFFPGAAMSMTLGGATTIGAAIPTPATAVPGGNVAGAAAVTAASPAAASSVTVSEPASPAESART